MIRSMTGFGTAERDTAAGRVRVEIKTVNHDTFRVSFRLPPSLEMAEPQIRDWLRPYVHRGQVHYALKVEPVEVPAGTTLRLDEDRVREYIGLLGTLKERFGLPGDVDVAMLSRYHDIIIRRDEDAPEVDLEVVREATEEAARGVVALREEEGRRLEADLLERLEAIEESLAVVAERAPMRLIEERDRLRAAIAELAGGVGVDEDRLAREIAYLAEKWDISEELVRLQSHIALFRETLALEAAEPVGKRLRFVCQEMLREANTIGSKANDVTIQHRVISIKNEIDRLREQIENVE
jgi:uncharacterized protein (TIGR00255 family)